MQTWCLWKTEEAIETEVSDSCELPLTTELWVLGIKPQGLWKSNQSS